MRVIPKRDWSDAHHWLIFHGRRVCRARKPDCGACTLNPWCAAQSISGASADRQTADSANIAAPNSGTDDAIGTVGTI
jgi:endonuclease-3